MKYSRVAICGLLAGCMASNGLEYEAVSTNNLYHIARVRKGMSETQVIQIMGRPYSYESFSVADDVYDVWFYVTKTTGLDQTRMVPQNLTPLTFKNGILVGTGYSWYYYAMKEQADAVAAQNPTPPEKTSEEEDVEFENALKSFHPETPAPSPAPQTVPQTKTPPPQPARPAQTTMAQPIYEESQEEKFTRLFKGMTETQVFAVMGKPASRDTFELDGEVYNVWFYESLSSSSQRMTPLTFKNTLLVGMSEDYYFGVRDIADRESSEGAPSSKASLQPNGPPSFIRAWKTSSPIAAAPRVKFSKAKIGMTEQEVTDLLGSPSSSESYALGDDLYDVWFYGDPKQPLTFKNNVLVSKSKGYYEDVKKNGSPQQIEGYDRDAERFQQNESEQNFDYW